MKNFISILFLSVLLSCGKQTNAPIEENTLQGDPLTVLSQCQCTMQEDKICGIDDITYLNDCISSCYQITTKHQDECKRTVSQTMCASVFDPVCGFNGITYSNSCHAENDGVNRYSKGACL